MKEQLSSSSYLRRKLLNVTRGLRDGTDKLVAYRRKFCIECEAEGKIIKPNGTIKCPLCGCKDPALYRPRCPASKW